MSSSNNVRIVSSRNKTISRHRLNSGIISVIISSTAMGAGLIWLIALKETRAQDQNAAKTPAGQGHRKPASEDVAAATTSRVPWRKLASNEPGALGAFLNIGTLPPPEFQALTRRQDRNGAVLKEQLALWETALRAAEAVSDRQALLINLLIFDPLYSEDEYQPHKSSLYLKRIAGLDQATIGRWKTAYSLSAIEAVWDLIQVETLFEGDTFRASALEEALADAETKKAEEMERHRLLDAEQKKRNEEAEVQQKAAERARHDRIEQAKWRTWLSADGAHRTEAKFVSFSAGTVTLVKKDGKKIKVPIGRLAEEDQQFIRERKWLK